MPSASTARLHGVLWQRLRSGAALETGGRSPASRSDGRPHCATGEMSARVSSRARRVRCAFAAARPVAGNGAKPFRYGAVWASVPDLGIASGRLAQRYVEASVMIGYLPIGRATAGGPELAALFWSLRTADYRRVAQGVPAMAQAHRRALARACTQHRSAARAGRPDARKLPALHRGETVQRAGRVGRRFAHATSPQLGGRATAALPELATQLDRQRTSPAPGALCKIASRSRALLPARELDHDAILPIGFAQPRAYPRPHLPSHEVVPYLRREMVRTLAD